MNLNVRLSLTSNTSGTDRLSSVIEKNMSIEAPLANSSRVDTSGGVTICDSSDVVFLYAKNLSSTAITVTFEAQASVTLAQNEFMFVPVKASVTVTATSTGSATLEYGYWTKA